MQMLRTCAAAFIGILLFTGLPVASYAGQAVVPAAKRVALIIGNSSYDQLGSLQNAASDATAIDDALKSLGFTTSLVLDASSDRTRRALRQFSGDSTNADVALVFYAGHGAQVAGSNYLLPVDMAPPRFETDITLDGLKVDDLINTIRARTVVVFLDACRDNPALFQNLATGRGATTTVGLAPSSTLNTTAMNGGLFIGYATDAGAVAADGTGSHSPFTDALLRHIRTPISLDDMFTRVTREVRLTTSGTQRPYKYASLNSIVCLTGTCGPIQPTMPTGVLETALRSEADDYSSALAANNATALKTYLDTYPESPRRDEALREWSWLRRQPFTEWTVTDLDVDESTLSGYSRTSVQLASIQVMEDRVVIRKKIDEDDFEPGGYKIFTEVFDCTRPRYFGKTSEIEHFDASNNSLERFKLADPLVLDLSDLFPVMPGTNGWEERQFACTETLRTPLVDKADLVDTTLTPMASGPFYTGPSASTFGDLFYLPNRVVTFEDPDGTPRHWREAVTLAKYSEPLSVANYYGIMDIDTEMDATYVAHATLNLIDCVSSQVRTAVSEFYDADSQLVVKIAASGTMSFVDIVGGNSISSTLQTLVCAQVGEL